MSTIVALIVHRIEADCAKKYSTHHTIILMIFFFLRRKIALLMSQANSAVDAKFHQLVKNRSFHVKRISYLKEQKEFNFMFKIDQI